MVIVEILEVKHRECFLHVWEKSRLLNPDVTSKTLNALKASRAFFTSILQFWSASDLNAIANLLTIAFIS